jgi:hypothetical protein
LAKPTQERAEEDLSDEILDVILESKVDKLFGLEIKIALMEMKIQHGRTLADP